jgi:hypothetical protein
VRLEPRRVLAARTLAVVADAVQLGVMPLFVQGALSTVNDALDVLVAVALVALVGWHWAFVPAFLAELIPVFDLVPTWTAAVFLATRQPGEPADPQLPPASLPDEKPVVRAAPPKP